MADVITDSGRLTREKLDELGKKQIEKFFERRQATDKLKTQEIFRSGDISLMTGFERKEFLESEGLGVDLPNIKGEFDAGLFRGGDSRNPEEIAVAQENYIETIKGLPDDLDLRTDEVLLGPSTLEKIKNTKGLSEGEAQDKLLELDGKRVQDYFDRDNEEMRSRLEKLWISADTDIKVVLSKNSSLEKGKLVFKGNGELDGEEAEIPIETIIEVLPTDKKEWFRDGSIDLSKPDEVSSRLKSRIQKLYLGKGEKKKFIGSNRVIIEFPDTELKNSLQERNLVFDQESLKEKFGTANQDSESDNDLRNFFTLYHWWKDGNISTLILGCDNGRFTKITVIDKENKKVEVSWVIFQFAFGLIKNVKGVNGKVIEGMRFSDENYIFGPDTSESELESLFRSIKIGKKNLPRETAFRKEMSKKE